MYIYLLSHGAYYCLLAGRDGGPQVRVPAAPPIGSADPNSAMHLGPALLSASRPGLVLRQIIGLGPCQLECEMLAVIVSTSLRTDGFEFPEFLGFSMSYEATVPSRGYRRSTKDSDSILQGPPRAIPTYDGVKCAVYRYLNIHTCRDIFPA